MKFRKEIYELKERDFPSDFEAYQKELKKRCAEEKKQYKTNVEKNEKMYLTFFERNKRKLECVFIALGGCIIIMLVVWGNNKNKIHIEDKIQDTVAEEYSSDTNEDVSTNSESAQSSDTKKVSSMNKKQKSNKWKVGDKVFFCGVIQYKASDSNKSVVKVEPGNARITKIKKKALHAYHLIGISDDSKIHGWVDESDLKKID